MEANDRKGWKKLKIEHKADEGTGSGGEENQNEPAANHSSQGHTTDAKGTATSTREPTLRAATTDSSRAPKNENDERPTGGNVR